MGIYLNDTPSYGWSIKDCVCVKKTKKIIK